MSSVIDELVVSLGIDVNAGSFENVRRMGEGLETITKGAMKMGAGITAAIGGFLFLGEKLNDSAASIQKMADVSGMNTREIQKMGLAVESIGGNFTQTQNELLSFTAQLSEAFPGEYFQGLVRIIGMDKYLQVHKSTMESILAIADSPRWRNATQTERFQLAKEAGLSQDMVRFLSKTPQEIRAILEQMEKSGNILSPETTEHALKFTEHMKALRRTFTTLAEAMAAQFEPELDNISKKMQGWIKENRELIGLDLRATVLGISDAFKTLGNIVSSLPGFSGASTDPNKLQSLVKAITLMVLSFAAFKIISPLIIGLVRGVAALAMLAGLTGPWGAAIALIVGGIALIVTNWDKVKRIVSETGLWFRRMGEEVMHYLDDLGTKITNWTDKLEGKFRKEHPWLAAVTIGNGAPTEQDYTDTSRMLGGKPSGNALQREAGLDPLIDWVSKYYGLPKALIQAMTQSESGFNPNATSPKGARGLMQLMPGTAKDLGVKNSYDPYQNLMGGAQYLTQLIKIFHGNMQKVIEAYNAGPGNIMKGRIPSETRKYLNDVLDHYRYWQQQGKRYPLPASSGNKSSSTNVTINQHIHGSDAHEIAGRSSKKISIALQRTFPGGPAPVVG